MTKKGAWRIEVFGRVRPPGSNVQIKARSDCSEYYDIEYPNVINIRAPPRGSADSESHHRYKFDHMFDAQTKQEEVFNRLCRPSIENVLEGYNATIFAYGQTGSGKTYSMTGGDGGYDERGVMPRALETLFMEMKKNTEWNSEMWVSYMQLYLEKGYDLLGKPARDSQGLEALPRVHLLDDEDGALHCKNLSSHRADDIEDALEFLWTGDMNRTTASTSQNNESSRSHCILTIHIRQSRVGSDKVRISKLNFVDLAGSERVAKTGADGVILQQAKYINSSLYYLVQVIDALAKRAKMPRSQRDEVHIPYRNSMMTSILRDSLGGNCRTSMLAAIAVEPGCLWESVSSCNFANRVGEIENMTSINEQMDPKLLIKRLKAENRALREEVQLLKEGEGASAARVLTPDDEELVQQRVDSYIGKGVGDKGTLDVGSWLKLQYALTLMRQRILSDHGNASPPAHHSPPSNTDNVAGPGAPVVRGATDAELDKLRALLQQRDAEIEVLTSMVSEGGGGMPSGGMAVNNSGSTGGNGRGGFDYGIPLVSSDTRVVNSDQAQQLTRDSGGGRKDRARATRPAPVAGDPLSLCSVDPKTLTEADLSSDTESKNSIFEKFFHGYYRSERMASDKANLNKVTSSAKTRASALRRLKNESSELKAMLQEGDDPEVRQRLGDVRALYAEEREQLASLKIEHDALKGTLDRQMSELKTDFQRWYSAARKVIEASGHRRASEARHSSQRSSLSSSREASRERERSRHSSHRSRDSHRPSTGHSDTDADVEAFYKARDQMKRTSPSRGAYS
ncbi:kinesin-like protein [Kipferlia bialata]|uniref:Kinesin-like protein n=1 Tax=Kipferlia bialata TaxID=797122 RepID=A0A9K3GFJ4_9EUKA|nr:kinesin-like protein [Kipferlia bialata]|eukprot:g1921.t1